MNKQLIFNSEPYIINNKNYSSIQFTIFFQFPYNKKHIGYSKMLRLLLMNSSLEYNAEESYNKARKERMIISQSAKTHKFNNNVFFEFNLIVPDPKKVKDYDLESAFKFFIDTIYKPNLENNEFNNYYFEREKKYIKETILKKKKSIYNIAKENFINATDDIGILKDNLSNNIELLDDITSKSLYDFYKTNIINNSPILIAYGDIDDNIKNLFYKYINIKEEKIAINNDYYNFLKPFKQIKDIEENSKYYQSILYMGYKIKDMTENDIIYLSFLDDILGSNNLLFKSLRNKENLIYHVSTLYRQSAGLYAFVTYIDNNSKEIAIKTIKETLETLYDKELLQKYTNKLISNLECQQIRSLDSRTKKLNDFILKSFEFDLTLEELIIQYKNIDTNKFYDFLNRFTLDTIYFLRGEFNGK